MSSTRQQRQRSASPAPPGESDSNINVTQRGEFTYLEIKKMYSCPAKCGTESNDKSHMLRHIWVDHREEDGLNLMKQFQIDSGGKSVVPYKCYGCDKQPVFRHSALFSHFLEHINEAKEYTERLANEVLEEIKADEELKRIPVIVMTTNPASKKTKKKSTNRTQPARKPVS